MPQVYTKKDLDRKMERLRTINRNLRASIENVREVECSDRMVNKRLRERVLNFMQEEASERSTKEIPFKEFLEWADFITLYDLREAIARDDVSRLDPVY